MPADELHARVLRWSNDLLRARTLAGVVERLAEPPAADGEALVGTLVLLDPRHELRRLASGEHDGPLQGAALRFSDSLASVAPAYGSLHVPWGGPFHAADHALIFPPELGLTHLLMLPLAEARGPAGVYNVGSRGGGAALGTLDGDWREHLVGQVQATVERLFECARLRRAGVVDPVTGWNSRHYFQMRLREQVATCVRRGEPATCVVVDVDGLGAINERHGVAAGDAVLREIGARLEAQARGSDAFAHLGEDEFAVLLPATPPTLALHLVDRILAAIRGAPVALWPDVERHVGVSIGIAGYETAPHRTDRKSAADQWLAEAQAAMHVAKRRGGDAWAISGAAVPSAPGT